MSADPGDEKKGLLQGHVHTSTVVLVTIAMFDLVTTLMLLNQGFGESNPIFAPLVARGSLVFSLGKLLFLAVPVLILEFARKHHPKSAEQGTWIAAIAYGTLYLLHLVRHFG